MHTISFSRIKKLIIPSFVCLFLLFLLFFSKQIISSSKSGLILWADSIVPTLLPFFIATELLSHTFVVPFIGRILNNIMRPLFNVPGEGAFALVMGLISGFPIGAKIVSDFYKKGIFNNIEAERLLAFTSNSGPLFIIGTVGTSFFGDTRTGLLLLITHILSSITVGAIFKYWKKNYNINYSKRIQTNNTLFKSDLCFSNLGETLGLAIINSINTLLLVGGFVVLFSVIISMLWNCGLISLLSQFIKPVLKIFGFDLSFADGIITGLIELTNGVKQISLVQIKPISQNIIVTSFLLGFSGFSVLFQIYSIVSKVGLSLKTYIIGKVLQAFLAALYTYLLLNTSLFFNLDLI